MIEKNYTPKRTVCKVTFRVPGDWANDEVKLVGDFNGWNTEADKLKKKKGHWEITKRLKPKSEYHFRYLIDGQTWKNDDAADRYVSNEFGSENSVIITGE